MVKAVQKARRLRREQTNAEYLLWQCLRDQHLKYKFRRQLPVGPYIADFACLELKLNIEVDGWHHCENERDVRRTKYLGDLGYEVLRFWNTEVEGNLEGVVSTLTLVLSQRERGLEAFASRKELS